MLWLKGRAVISGILLFIGFLGKARKPTLPRSVGLRRSKFNVSHIQDAMTIRSEAARNQIAEQDTEGRHGKQLLKPYPAGYCLFLEMVSDPRAESSYIKIV